MKSQIVISRKGYMNKNSKRSTNHEEAERELQRLLEKLGKKIAKYRVAAGLTQERLAENVKVRQATIAKLEKGRYIPKIALLQRIAKALGRVLKITFRKIKR